MAASAKSAFVVRGLASDEVTMRAHSEERAESHLHDPLLNLWLVSRSSFSQPLASPLLP